MRKYENVTPLKPPTCIRRCSVGQQTARNTALGGQRLQDRTNVRWTVHMYAAGPRAPLALRHPRLHCLVLGFRQRSVSGHSSRANALLRRQAGTLDTTAAAAVAAQLLLLLLRALDTTAATAGRGRALSPPSPR